MKCSQLPDITSWSALNTYLNVWHGTVEDKLVDTMEQCKESANVRSSYHVYQRLLLLPARTP